MTKALERQERDTIFTKVVLENLQEGIMVEDTNCQMTYVNRRMAEMLGYDTVDLIGKHWKMTVKDDDLWKVARESVGRDKGTGGKYLVNLKHKDGSPVPVLITATPLLDGKDFKGVISLATDVSRLMALEQELKDSKNELEQMNTELKRFNVRLAEDNIRLRKMMDITPEMEAKGTKGGGKYHIEPAHIYMIKTDSPVSPYIIFSDLVKHGMEGLCITREKPSDVRRAHELEKTPVIWLTTNRVPDVDTISPTNMVDLSSVILSFLEKASNGVVLVDGLDYLIAQNSFMATLNLVQLLRDKVMLSRSRVIIPLDQGVLDPRDLHMLTKEAIVFDVHEKDLEYFLAAPR
jgi:PAS domain S-box-containing protein